MSEEEGQDDYQQDAIMATDQDEMQEADEQGGMQ